MCGTTILFKQTTGVVFAIIFVFYKIVQIQNKEEIKAYLKIMIARLISSIIPILILGIYLSINGIWIDFLDYSVFGVRTFSNKIFYLALFKEKSFFIKILAGLVPIQIIIMIAIYLSAYKKKELDNKEWYKNLFLLLIYSATSMSVIIPISDKSHFATGSFITIISMVYLVNVIVKKIATGKIKIYMKKAMELGSKGLFFLAMASSVYLVVTNYIHKEERKHGINHFNNIVIEKNMQDRILDIGDYILQVEQEGKQVYILDSIASIYKIPVDKYDKNYDMFNLGNFGSKGEEGIIEDIENKKDNLILLILQDKYEQNWQSPKKVIEYVKNNFRQIGRIRIFDVYE